MIHTNKRDKFRGLLLGTAVGDSIGLPAEGISRRRNRKLFKGIWRQRLIFNRGMISDDTEHTVFVAQCLLAGSDASLRFAKRLAFCLRWWMVSLPAGIGFATLRAIIRLWIGFKPDKSGVFSAGNGPAMRSAPIGAFFAQSPVQLDEFVLRSTRITHTDPKALTGAKAVAYLAAWILRENLTKENRPASPEFIEILLSAGKGDKEWTDRIQLMTSALSSNLSVIEFAESMGQTRGVSGYIYDTVPVAAYAWHKHFGDFEKTLSAIFDCGGDTDTAGAIAGALSGAVVGLSGIPPEWVKGIWDWPRGGSLLMKIADRLFEKQHDLSITSPVPYFWPGVLLRNLFFLMIVLLHGFRRLAPPY